MLKDMLENTLNRKVDDEVYRLALYVTTEYIVSHNIKQDKVLTKIDFVMSKLIKTISVIEKICEKNSCKNIRKDSLQTA